MRAIIYLYKKKAIGWLRNSLKHPSQLISLVFVVGIMVLSILNARNTQLYDMFSKEGGAAADQATINLVNNSITIGIWAIVATTILISLFNAAKKGVTQYSMADVQFIMTAPFKSQNVLLYGMLNKFLGTLILGIFIVYLAPQLKAVGFQDSRLGFFVFGIILILICVQAWKQAIYVLCINNKQVNKVLKISILTLAGVILGAGLAYFFLANGTTEGLADILSNNILIRYFPLFGWAANFIVIAFKGDLINLILPAILLIASAVLAVVYTYSVDVDFYEDATNAAKEVADLQEKVKNNKTGIMVNYNKKHKVRDKGLNGGRGESAFLFLHLAETRRRKPYYVGISTLIYAVIAVVMYFLLKEKVTMGSEINRETVLFIFMGACAYFMYYLSMANPVLSDMTQPYFYYLPGKSYKKVIYSSLTPVIYTLIDVLPAMIILFSLFRMNIIVLLSVYLAIAIFNFFYMGLQIYVFSLAGSFEGVLAQFIMPFIMLIGIAPAVAGLIFTAIFAMQYGVWLYLLGILAVVIYILLFYAGSVAVAAWRLNKGLRE